MSHRNGIGLHGIFTLALALVMGCVGVPDDGVNAPSENVGVSVEPIVQSATGQWATLGIPSVGTPTSDPDACAWGIGRLAVVERTVTSGNNGAVNVITGTTVNGALSWSVWASLGYPPQTTGVRGNPTCASTSDGTLNVWVTGNDQKIYQQTFNGTSWSGWTAIPVPTPNGETILGLDANGRSSDGLLRMTVSTVAAVWDRTWTPSAGWGAWLRLGYRTSDMVGDASSTAAGPPCPLGYACYAGAPTWINRTYASGLSYVDTFFSGGVGHFFSEPSPRVAGVDAAVDARGRVHVAFLNQNRSVGVMVYDSPDLPSERQHNLPFSGTLYSTAPVTNFAPTIAMYRQCAADTQGSEAVFVIAANNTLYVNFQNPTLVWNENLSFMLHNSFIWRGGDSAVDWNNGFTPAEVLQRVTRAPATGPWSPTIRNLEIDLHIMKAPDIASACPAGRWGIEHITGEYGVYQSNNCAFGPMGNDGAASRPGPITDLYNWHNSHPNHELILVDFEVMHDGTKGAGSPGNGIDDGSGTGAHTAGAFDAALAAIRPFLFTPGDFLRLCPAAGGTLKGLQNALRLHQCNYPTLEELRGKIIVILQGGVGPYFSDAPNGRLAFQMSSTLADPASPDAAIFYDTNVSNSSSGALAVMRGQMPIASPGGTPILPFFTGTTYGLSDAITPWVTGMVANNFSAGARGVLKLDYESILWPGWTHHTGSSAPTTWGGRLDTASSFPFCPDTGKTNPNTLSADCQAELPGLVENLQPNMTPNQARPLRGDSCRNPKTLFEHRSSWSYAGTTLGRADDFVGAGSCGGAGAPDEVYVLNITQTKLVRLNTSGSQFHTTLSLRDGASTCPGTAELACANENYVRGTPGYLSGHAYIETVLNPGTYYVVIDGYAGAYGNYELQVDLIDPLPAVGATAGSTWDGAPSNVVDRNLGNIWNSGSFPSAATWIQIDLGAVRNFRRIRLLPRISPSGTTTQAIYVGPTPSPTTLLSAWTGQTNDRQWVDLSLSGSARYVRILTTASPSWVAWGEIELYP